MFFQPLVYQQTDKRMRKQFKTTFFLLLIALGYNGVAQNLPTNNEADIKGSSRLDLGVSIYDRAKFNQLGGFTIGYERFLSSNLSFDVDLFANFFNKNNFGDFTSTRLLGISGGNTTTLQNYRNRLSLSFAVNYYLKSNSGSGHYLSFVANNLIALTNRAQTNINSDRSFTSKIDKGVVRTLPVLGIYYGYRKDFKSGFFIDGKVGFARRLPPVTLFTPNNDSIIDGKLSLGWRIDFKKNKKKKGN